MTPCSEDRMFDVERVLSAKCVPEMRIDMGQTANVG